VGDQQGRGARLPQGGSVTSRTSALSWLSSPLKGSSSSTTGRLAGQGAGQRHALLLAAGQRLG
jgi:hypothetical protein